MKMKVLIRDDYDMGVYGILDFDDNEVSLDIIKSKLKNGKRAELYLNEKIELLKKKYPSVKWETEPITIWY